MGDRGTVKGLAAAALAMIGWAASGVIAKSIDLGTFAVVFWRMWLYTSVILGYLAIRRRPLSMRALRIALPGGIALGLDVILFFSAIKLTTVANATVIGSLQPVIMLWIARPIFGEIPRVVDWMLAAVALAGVGMVIFGSSGLPEWNLTGDLVAVATVFAWTSYFVFSKLTRDRIDAFEYTAATALIASLVATPPALISGQLSSLPDVNNWIWLAVMALGPGFASHLLMNYSLGAIPAWVASTLTLAIPVSATLLAWWFLGESVVLWQFVGMTVVTAALVAVVVGQSRRVAPVPEVVSAS